MPAGILQRLKEIGRRLSADSGGKLGYLTRFVFIDFEASSLSEDSWPIEVGLAWFSPEGRIETWSSLIRPAQDWPALDWSEESEKIHGISQEALEEAPEISEVAAQVMDRICDRSMVSDAPDHDREWLNRLLEADGRAKLEQLRDFHYMTITMFRDDKSHAAVGEYLAETPAPHRAGPDAERMARAWVAGLAQDLKRKPR